MTARILLIEDNPPNLDLMAFLLRAYGYGSIAAADGEEGLRAALAEPPDLVLCDIQLPGLDGYDVLRKLREAPALRHVPVVAVTAVAMVGAREEAFKAGFNGYISKPISPESFVPQVESFLAPALRSSHAPRQAEEGPSPPVQVPAPFVGEHRGVILVVDDVLANLELTTSILESVGYGVILARSAEEALTCARTSHPDMILSDLHMPGEDGYALLRQIKADPDLRSIPFVIVSASSDLLTDNDRWRKYGADAFIRRPIEPGDLLNEIEARIKGLRRT